MRPCQILVLLLLSLLTANAWAKTGVFEVYTTPPGAEVFIDNIYVGQTPYAAPDIEVGTHSVSLFLEKTGVRSSFTISVDSITPQIYRFDFQNTKTRKFDGVIEKPTLMIDKGNIQFASIPTGARVLINGEEKAKTPVSFRDVDVGSYRVSFVLGDKTLNGQFHIFKNETGKLIADFNRSEIIDKWKEEKSKIERKEKAQKEHQLEAKEQQREEHTLAELQHLSPEVRAKILRARDQQHEVISIEEMYEANRSYYYTAMDLDPAVVSYYKLPYDRLTLELKNLKKAKSARLGDYYEGEYIFRYGKHTRRGHLNSSNLASCRFTLYNDLTIKVRYDPDDYGAGQGKGKVFVSVR